MNISVFRIDGAHAKVYAKLINKIQIPSLIITDIDFKKETKKTNTVEATGEIDSAVESDVSDGIIEQISTLSEDLITTNATLCHFLPIKEFHQ